MNLESAISTAQKIASEIAAGSAAENDRSATYPRAVMEALGEAGLLGINVAEDQGGLGLGPRAVAGVIAAIAEVDASVAMVYMMHICGTACITAAPEGDFSKVLKDIAAGKHISTLAFSEKGSRSHFWAPVSKAVAHDGGVKINASKSYVTSAGEADSYVTTTQSVTAGAPTESTLYLVSGDAPGLQVGQAFDGLGLRANASAPMEMRDVVVDNTQRLSSEGDGFNVKLNTVLPMFNLGCAAVALGISRAAVAATCGHLSTATFQHLDNVKLGEALPTLRASAARMQIKTDALATMIDETISSLENPGEQTMLRVLEAKALGGETALEVTQMAMRACGGAAFARALPLERYFRDAQAGSIMAPTTDVLYDFIGKALLGIPLF